MDGITGHDHRMKRGLHLGAALLGIVILQQASEAAFSRAQDEAEQPIPARNAEFHFLRLEYTDLPQYPSGIGATLRAMDWVRDGG